MAEREWEMIDSSQNDAACCVKETMKSRLLSEKLYLINFIAHV